MRVRHSETCEYFQKLLPQLWCIGVKQVAMSAYTEDERDSLRPWTTVGVRRFPLHALAFVRNTLPQADIARNGRSTVIRQL